ncbi:MAG: glycosyltransferase family 2 protein [Capnocytophaga sp.]|nr:glycosyltransferase family 2 protein [Capnocytophaga sp.]
METKNDFLLSVVVPLYNEEENAALLIQKVDEALRDYRYELILVDDFSTDETRKVVKESALPNTVLIEFKRNYGQSSALMAGIDYAHGDYIITLDGDLQNDPSDIPMMLNTLQSGDWDVVAGERVKRKDSFIRTLPSKIANFIIRRTTGLDIKDHGCALKIFTRETAKELNIYGEFHRFITLLAYVNGARIKQVPTKHHSRKFGKSKYGFERIFKVLNDLLLLLFQQKFIQKPIYLLGNIGLISFGLGFLINIYLLIIKIMGYQIGDRPLLLLGVMLIMVGVQLFTMGILLDMQMKTYFESQGKRPFNIRKVTTFEKEN